MEPHDFEETQFEAIRLIERGHYARAREVLGANFRANPDDVESHVLAARAALADDDIDGAEEHLESALAVNASDWSARSVLAKVHEERERFPEAEAVYIELAREEPTNADLYAALAQLMVKTLNIERAKEFLAEALRIEPDHAQAQGLEALIAIIDGRSSDADNALARLIANDPQAAHVLATLFRALVARRRYRAAIEVGQALLRLGPDNAALIEVLVQLRVITHWSMLPMWPINRWGWAASAVIWGAFALLIFGARNVLEPTTRSVIIGAWLAFVVYTWAYPALLKRWFQSRGIG